MSSFLADLSKVISKRQMLDAQLSENKSVLEELTGMNSDNKVRRDHLFLTSFYPFTHYPVLAPPASARKLFRKLRLQHNLNIFTHKIFRQVFKLYGPVLVRQELEECRQNVGKRMEFINKEIKRCHTSITTLEKEQDKHHESISKLQQQYQVSMAMK